MIFPKYYYDVLGVPQDASLETIQLGYEQRKLKLINSELQINSNLELIYFTLANTNKRRVYDQYGRWGLIILETPYATYVEPDKLSVLMWYLLQTSITSMGILLTLLLLSVQFDSIISININLIFLPIQLTIIILLITKLTVIYQCLTNKIMSPGYVDRFLEGVPGHPRYPTRYSFIRIHMMSIGKLILLTGFIIILQLILLNYPIPPFFLCIPLLPFLFTRNVVYVIQCLLIGIKISEITLETTSWHQIFTPTYLTLTWELIFLLWRGWKIARPDRDRMAYYRDHYQSVFHTQLILWASLHLRPWLLKTATIIIFSYYLLEDGPLYYPNMSILVISSPILLGCFQNFITTGLLLPIIILITQYKFTPFTSLDSKPRVITFSPPTHPDAQCLTLNPKSSPKS